MPSVPPPGKTPLDALPLNTPRALCPLASVVPKVVMPTFVSVIDEPVPTRSAPTAPSPVVAIAVPVTLTLVPAP